MQNEDQLNSIDINNETYTLREEIEKYVYHWKWFVFGVLFSLVSAFIYLRYTPNQYDVATKILIDEDNKGGLASELSAFEDLGLLGGSQTSIDNEIELLKSITLMERVVKDLGINVTYYRKGRIITSELFFKNLPVKINFFSKDSIFYKKDT
jgi:tyrosine-protein kinase Etk/Wzc